MTCLAVSANQTTQNQKHFLWRQSLWVYDMARQENWSSITNLYQTIPKVRLCKMVVWHIISWEVYSGILFQRDARESPIFSNMTV